MGDEVEALVFRRQQRRSTDPFQAARAVRAGSGDIGSHYAKPHGVVIQVERHRGRQGWTSSSISVSVASPASLRRDVPCAICSHTSAADRSEDHRTDQESQQRRARAVRGSSRRSRRFAMTSSTSLQKGQVRSGGRQLHRQLPCAFVDLWRRRRPRPRVGTVLKHIDHPSEVVEVGTEVTVEVPTSITASVSRQSPPGHAGRSVAAVRPHPRNGPGRSRSRHQRPCRSGAFVRVEDGIEGPCTSPSRRASR